MLWLQNIGKTISQMDIQNDIFYVLYFQEIE